MTLSEESGIGYLKSVFKIIKTTISFFLGRSLPPNTEGSAEPREAIGASLRTQFRVFKSYNLCLDSSLRSRMTGKYLILFRKKPFFCFYSYLPLPTSGDSFFV